ncbi:hypothetical protein TTHERM_000655839 (macronuclear) [Tetrahymena thermophila SB210]|uniref:Uncharacterized protein n=1 Tax=Tetrahymena thermophila (strain SB210) TaxID=312017 RepID=W7WZP7_TETTS|nr:hypothetical protein TTHERM_000655839 [Tetrahymena thermophila SB210]EWS72315.1 hypothetical protein TTHERM_000655839 [Tetrahymena thermophila SB210]|eukprot:XP_012655149.1 hypothetical protein TTHERM_000655839 [Tetrahymena thermophila SB210]
MKFTNTLIKLISLKHIYCLFQMRVEYFMAWKTRLDYCQENTLAALQDKPIKNKQWQLFCSFIYKITIDKQRNKKKKNISWDDDHKFSTTVFIIYMLIQRIPDTRNQLNQFIMKTISQAIQFIFFNLLNRKQE